MLKERAGEANARIFECHLMLLEDPSFVGEAERQIAEAASTRRRRCAGLRAGCARSSTA